MASHQQYRAYESALDLLATANYETEDFEELMGNDLYILQNAQGLMVLSES